MHNCAIQINLDQNQLWKWINQDRIRIGQMCIQCGHAQTGFNLAQYTLGVQCGQAFSLILREKEIW